jgi:hypothetical protein
MPVLKPPTRPVYLRSIIEIDWHCYAMRAAYTGKRARAFEGRCAVEAKRTRVEKKAPRTHYNPAKGALGTGHLTTRYGGERSHNKQTWM